MNDTKSIEEESKKKIQYILDENRNLAEIWKEDMISVEYPIKYPIKSAFEVFVRINKTENYWISNYGRCVNNLNHKDKNTFYKHKEGNVHYTIFEITRYITRIKKRGVYTGEVKEEIERWKRDTRPDELVAEAFLAQYPNRRKVWHKDGDFSNNWYKNLIYVSVADLQKLKAGAVSWQSLGLEQKYIEYENKASSFACRTYAAIRKRCENTKDKDAELPFCYRGTRMCQEWTEDPKSFIKWYLEHYYNVGEESMAVDKDLFGNGQKLYSPETCCILPNGLNTMLSNCVRHYHDATGNGLPMCVHKNGCGKYYGIITFTGSDKKIKLSEWDTPEEAFAEYKRMKQADICLVAVKYKESIPEFIYKKLLEVEIKPY